MKFLRSENVKLAIVTCALTLVVACGTDDDKVLEKRSEITLEEQEGFGLKTKDKGVCKSHDGIDKIRKKEHRVQCNKLLPY